MLALARSLCNMLKSLDETWGDLGTGFVVLWFKVAQGGSSSISFG